MDGGSTDRTVEVARRAGATVIENRWPGFAAQRNVALDIATSDWILEIDADECISRELRESIESLLDTGGPGAGMAVCPLRHRFLGRALGPSAKYPAYRARIFRRGAYRHDEARMVHEGVEPHERPMVLEGDLEHELAATLEEALLDALRYARLESSHLAKPSTPRAYLTGIVLRPAAKLVYRTLVDGGWRDGWQGMVKICLDAASDALVWILALLRRGPASDSGEVGHLEHFGRRPSGPVKIVAIAGTPDATRTATRWLADLRTRGLDVALIAPSASLVAGEIAAQETAGVPVRPLGHLHPLELIRALDVETQLRTTDAVVAVGPRASFLRRLLPRTLRPAIPGLHVALDAERAAELVNAAVSRGD